MPIVTRTFRVFVSSTFEDLKEERNALQRDVFPTLRTLCERHGARFQAIDLRWGVSDEAALDQQTMEICRREIRRCQATGVHPNFIVLLGDNYGWQPLPARILATEFDALAVDTPWYKLDENADPPEYCLLPRTGEFVNRDAWGPEEQTLRKALAFAARAAGLDPIKYEASATHQEILAGLGQSEADRQHVFAFVRRPTANTDPRVEELKFHLRVHEFAPEVVLKQLSEVIESEIARFADRSDLDLEIEAHDRFAEERCRIFIGRETVLKTIADYIHGPDRRPLVLHGESGSGKSAAIAVASQRYTGPARMIRRFIGVSPASASGHALLTSLCRQIAPGDVPVDYAQLENVFRARLSLTTAKQPLVLFIDALDQLGVGDPARGVRWLPQELPPNVKAIVSTADNGEALRAGAPVQLDRMTQSEAGQALDELLWEAHRTLRPWQREAVLAHFERCGLPLYLKLAADESRLWKSYALPDACTLGEGVAGVINTLFARLSSSASHGPVLVEHSLSYLAAARYGLTEDEILDVLTADDAVWNDFDRRKHHEVSERRLPVVVWSRLSLDLEPYLTERAGPGGTVVAFYHRQLREYSASLSTNPQHQSAHLTLAAYFHGRDSFLESTHAQRTRSRRLPPTPRPANGRKVSELVYQRVQVLAKTPPTTLELEAACESLETLLTDIFFLEAKAEAGFVLDLALDFGAVLHILPATRPGFSILSLLNEALRRDLHFIARHPTTLFQCLWNACSWYPVDVSHHSALSFWHRRLGKWTAFRWIMLAGTRIHYPLLARGFAEHTILWFAAIDHYRLRIRDAVGRTAPSRRKHKDNIGRLLQSWRIKKGRSIGYWLASLRPPATPLGSGPVTVLRANSGAITALRVSAETGLLLSGSSDGTVRTWDVQSAAEVALPIGCGGEVSGVAFADLDYYVTACSNSTALSIRVPGSRMASFELRGHQGEITCLDAIPGRNLLATGSTDGTVRLWDCRARREISRLAGHEVTRWGGIRSARTLTSYRFGDPSTFRPGCIVNCVAFAPDSSLVASGANDDTIRIWDTASGKEVLCLKGHSGSVNSIAWFPDTLRIVSGSSDKSVRIWDVVTGICLAELRGHLDWVWSVDVSSDGKTIASAGGNRDMTVRL
jgi:hypothetical protein